VDLMAGKLKRLSSATQEALKPAIEEEHQRGAPYQMTSGAFRSHVSAVSGGKH